MNSDKIKVISFLNMKGGVSKTTLCKELGMYLALKKNKRMLFVDVDPQANLTQSLFRKYGYKQEDVLIDSSNQDEKFKTTIASIEKMVRKNKVKSPEIEHIILELDTNISIIPGELGIDFTTRNLNSSELEGSLYSFISENKLKDFYDYIFVDCPPTYSSYTILALKASEAFVIPVRPEAYSILGIKMLLNVVDYVLKTHDIYFQNKSLKNLGIIFTNIKKTPSTGTKNLIQQIKESNVIKQWKVEIFDTFFEYNSQIPKDIGYDIASSNSMISMENMDVLADEFLKRIRVVQNEEQ